jgi:hypothetical protein
MNNIFKEKINTSLLSIIIDNFDDFDIKYDATNKYKSKNKTKFKLKKILNNTKNGILEVNYKPSPKNIDGREYALDGCQNLKREIRQTLLKDSYIDYDMRAALPTILNWYAKENDLKNNVLEKILDNYSTIYKPNKEQITKLIFNGYCDDNCIKDIDVKLFKKELNIIYLFMRDNYKDIKNIKKDNINGSLCSIILQNYERKILDLSFKYLVKNNISIENAIKCFDGFMLLNNISINLNDLNNYIFENTGIKINYVIKPMNESIDLEKYDDYLLKKLEFEKTHCKIINLSSFIKEDNNDIKYFTKSKLISAYEHLPNSFISKWIKDKNIRVYEDIGCSPQKLNDKFFNTWKAFEASLLNKLESNEIENIKDDIAFILNHIKILCNHDETTYNYFIEWIACLIKHPEIKTINPTIISKEGAGKDSLIKILSNIIGHDRVLNTSSPSQYCWGEFNGQMSIAYLVVLDELSKKELMDAEGKFKTLITDPYIYINKKGVESFKMQSFHKFISLSNNDDPIKTSIDDRRNFIIKASDELCYNKVDLKDPNNEKNRIYWSRFYELLDNKKLIRGLYEYFIELDVINFNKKPIPRTEYHNDIIELYEPIELKFIKDISFKSKNKILKYTSDQLYNKFIKFLKDKNIENYKPNGISFSLKLKNLKIIGIDTEHTRAGNIKIIDVKKIKEKYGIKFIDDNDDDESDNEESCDELEI